MQKPTNCPDDICTEGHNWYYDTCERCGARKQVPDYISRKHEEERRYREQVTNLAGGR